MKLVLLSGGSGKRLWPLSNDSRSKQFLKVLKNENQEPESMVQRVWGQLTKNGLSNSTYIATSKIQESILLSQIGGQVPLIIEPERKDTYPAIALVAAYLHSVDNIPSDEVICVLPVDPYVENKFYEQVRRLGDLVSSKDNIDIALIGVTPTFPSEKYGYIMPSKERVSEEFETVSEFIEKPDVKTAELLISRNALWNCGVFAFKLGYMINHIEQAGLPTDYKNMLQQYAMIKPISFDYEVVEKAKRIAVVPYQGYWKDLGTWNTLTEEMNSEILGKGIIDKDCKNTHLINELDIPIAVLGLSDLVVAASPDGVLVSSKEASPKIKDLMKDNKQRQMYEESYWGWYKVLDYKKYEEHEVLTRRITIHAGKSLNENTPSKHQKTLVVLAGDGELILNENRMQIKLGDTCYIPQGSSHTIMASTDLELIEIQSGLKLSE